MGWTHSWQRPVELPAKQFAAAAVDLRALLAAGSAPLAGFDGTGEPRVDDDHVVFNGQAPQACEPFEIARVEFDRRGRERVWSFCKTERLPYDLCVRAALVIFKHHLGDLIAVSSDGDDEDWGEARQLVQSELGYGEDFPLDKTE